jgi:2-oxoglutarate ferredoxin oxidoreductase subunit beta
MKDYKRYSKIRPGHPTSEVGLVKEGEIIVGKFVDKERPEFMDMMKAHLSKQLGDRYVQPVECESSCGEEVPQCSL